MKTVRRSAQARTILAVLCLYCSAVGVPRLPAQSRPIPPSQASVSQASAPHSLEDVLAAFDARLGWDPLAQQGILTMGAHRLAFQALPASIDVPVLFDGKDIFYWPSPYTADGALLFPVPFVESLKDTLDTARKNDLDHFRIAAIIIDPGHGGRDSGAIGTHAIDGKPLRLLEKDINLSVGLDLHKRLSLDFPDKRVLLTRSDDTFPSLEDRVSLANSVPLQAHEAVLFISIHANASFNKNARGYEVWYLSPDFRRTVIDASNFTGSAEVVPILNAMMEEEFTTESIIIAQSIMKRFDESIGKLSPSRGIKAEQWFVVRNARMPSVLVELGFVTNLEDARLLSDRSYLMKLSEALYKGTVDFVGNFEKSGGFITAR